MEEAEEGATTEEDEEEGEITMGVRYACDIMYLCVCLCVYIIENNEGIGMRV